MRQWRKCCEVCNEWQYWSFYAINLWLISLYRFTIGEGVPSAHENIFFLWYWIGGRGATVGDLHNKIIIWHVPSAEIESRGRELPGGNISLKKNVFHAAVVNKHLKFQQGRGREEAGYGDDFLNWEMEKFGFFSWIHVIFHVQMMSEPEN